MSEIAQMLGMAAGGFLIGFGFALGAWGGMKLASHWLGPLDINIGPINVNVKTAP